uniref:t-SNARE coiled-coil homology domain-containing protein n=1 Tax=Angiostrongylus cantonensis TaxID=6313 RepID=A0A0K0DJ00_ANGCA
MREGVGTVIRPVMLAHRQDMMSTSLNEKVDAIERLNEADSGHLLLELHVAEREVDRLVPRTQVYHCFVCCYE